MTRKTYYIYYTAKNNCKHKEIVKSKTLSQVIEYIDKYIKPLEYSLFDIDTCNTSETKGLIAFSANTYNHFYNSLKTK